MKGVRRALTFPMVCGLFLVATGLGVVVSGSVAGAALVTGPVSSLPWPNDGIYSEGTDQGECNEVYVNPPGTGTTWKLGGIVQFACQFAEPTGDTPGYFLIGLPESSEWQDQPLAGWDQTLSRNQWEYPGGSGGSPQSGTCGTVGHGIFFSAIAGDGPYCTSSITYNSGDVFEPNGPSGEDGGSKDWSAMEVIHSEVAGTDADGNHSLAVEGTLVINNDPESSYSGALNDGTDNHATEKLMAPLFSGTACPSSSALIGNELYFDPTLDGTSAYTYESNESEVAEIDSSGANSDAAGLDTVTCETPDQNGVSGESFTLPWYASLPDTYWVGGSATLAASPCTLVGVDEGQTNDDTGGDYTAGQSYSFVFSFQGKVSRIAVDPDDVGAGNDGDGGDDNYTGNGITSNISFDGDYLPQDAVVVDPASSPVTVPVRFTSTGHFDPWFYCDSAGTLFEWGDSISADQIPDNNSSGEQLGGGGGFDVSACFAGAGWSLFNPVSWVTGALKDGACIVEWLFIPSQSDVSNLTGLFGVNSDDPTAAVGAGQWLASLTTFATSAPSAAVSALQTGADSGSCPTAGNQTIDGASFSVCDSLASVSTVSSVSGPWAVLRDIVTAAFLIGMGLALFHLIRRAITGNVA